MYSALVFIAGVLCVPRLVDAQLVRSSLEEQCYNVGSCTPSEEPQGDQKEICKIFEDSLTCMQEAMEACRQLDFPPDTVHLASDGLRFLREELRTYCSDQLEQTEDADAADEDEDVGVTESFSRDAEIVAERSEQDQRDINSGNRLPCTSCSVLVISLLGMMGLWTAFS